MWNVSSPDGRLKILVTLDEDAPRWSVSWEGRDVLSPSALGLDLRGGGPLAAGLEALSADRDERDETYPLFSGKSATARDHHRELRLALQERSGSGRRLNLHVRAFNDGAAFRYVVPEQEALAEFTVTGERTEWRFPGDFSCWALLLPDFQSSYESEFPPRTLGMLMPDELIGLPLTLQTQDGPALAVTEAALDDWAGMYVRGQGGTGLSSVLSPNLDGGDACVQGRAPHASPWRVLQVAPTPAQLIESNILTHLNAPPAFADTSWVKPGKVCWDWWSGGIRDEAAMAGGMDDATMQCYMDFAAEHGIEYMLVDGGWYGESNSPDADLTRSVPEIHLPELVQYAAARGVDTLVWMHWQDTRNGRMETAFPYYERIGVKGVKVDFFDRDDQEVLRYIHRLLELAARHHIQVDLHGIHKPTGLTRTWPHLMTYEGIMGAEYNKWSTRITPTHNVTIPYTRMLAGPMDYTPGGFHSVPAAEFRPQDRAPRVMGTRAHQLAMYVVYESGFQMVSDYPEAIRGQPGADFLKVVPAAWDATRALGGAVGAWIALARRKGDAWFLGAMTNEEGRSVTLPLDFLGEGAFTAQVYADAPASADDPNALAVTTQTVRSSESLTLDLAPSGGCAVQFTPR